MRDTNYYKYVVYDNGYTTTAEPTEQPTSAPSLTRIIKKPPIPIKMSSPNYDETAFIAIFTTLSGILLFLFVLNCRKYMQKTAKAKRKLDESFGVAYTLDNV